MNAAEEISGVLTVFYSPDFDLFDEFVLSELIAPHYKVRPYIHYIHTIDTILPEL